MESLWSALATHLATAGGGIAVAFIVLLAVGIVSMTLLYVGSALLVLDRFARVARGWLVPALAGLCVAGFVALLSTLESFPSDSVYDWSEWRATFGQKLGTGIVACALFLAVVGAATRRISQATLGFVVAGIAAFAGGLALVAGLLPVSESGFPSPDAIDTMRAAASGLLALLVGAVVLGLVPLAIAGFLSMRRSVEWFIALRYLVAKRRQVFISAITAICVAGIAAGVWLIIVVLSVMNGFEQTWREEILGNRAHFTVHSSFGPFEDWQEVMKTVAAVPGVEAASPYLDAEGMVRGSHGEIASVRLRGIDPESVGRVTDLEGDLRSVEGEDAPDLVARFARQDGEEGAPGIVIGGHLAGSMGLAVGDGMLLISPFGGPPTPLGPGPRLKRFTVVGIFESSFYQYDEAFTYTTLEAARDFRKVGAVVDGIEARTTDHYRSRVVGDEVQAALGYPYYTRDWKEVFPAFFQALKTERVMMFLLLTMIMVVAAFVIVATLIMMIMEKSSDIAILKAMGAEDAMIERIFALEGTLIGLCGTALGVAAGIAVTGQLAWLQDRIERITGIDTLPASVYQFSELPSKVDPGQVAGVAVIAMILSLGATLLPSRQGARIDPAAGLRHE
ncbi:ABC transporter permease [Myxococcota bacterium]|nr:ABC transporter permease [Myxococcota bacterium]